MCFIQLECNRNQAVRDRWKFAVPSPSSLIWPEMGGNITSAVKRSIGSTTGFHNHIIEKAPTRLKAPTSASTFETLFRHYGNS